MPTGWRTSRKAAGRKRAWSDGMVNKMKDEFLDKKNTVAVVGATVNQEKWGYKVFVKLKDHFRKVYPVNPNYERIDGDRCYPGLKALPGKPDLVIMVVPPEVTEDAVRVCRELGITKVWMQPGSESGKAVEYCEKNGIECRYNACMVVDGLKDCF